MIRRILVPGSPLLGAAVLAKSSEESADGRKEKSLICKPSALPIYTSLVDRWLSLNIDFTISYSDQAKFWILVN